MQKSWDCQLVNYVVFFSINPLGKLHWENVSFKVFIGEGDKAWRAVRVGSSILEQIKVSFIVIIKHIRMHF